MPFSALRAHFMPESRWPARSMNGLLFYASREEHESRDWPRTLHSLRSVPPRKQSPAGSVWIQNDLVLKSLNTELWGSSRAWRRGRRLLQSSERLKSLGVEAPELVAIGFSPADKALYLLMNRLNGALADEALLKVRESLVARHELIDRLAARVASWHDAGVFHGDLKASNLIIDVNFGPSMVDYAQASFDPFFPLFAASRDLGQLISSLSPIAGRSDARRLLEGYAEGRRIGPIGRERIWQLALARARKRAARNSVEAQDWFFES